MSNFGETIKFPSETTAVERCLYYQHIYLKNTRRIVMSKQRNHMQSIHKSVYHDVNTGAYAALGGPFYIKKF